MPTKPRRPQRPRRPKRSGPPKKARASAHEVARASKDRADVIGVYQRITLIVWQRLSPTFGMRTINAIARNVIAKRSRDRELALLQVGPDGLLWDKLEADVSAISGSGLQEQLDGFISDFFEALANLIGRLMVGKIFKEAEELARQGDDE